MPDGIHFWRAVRRIKALRLFTDPAGWQAEYTNRTAGPLAATP